uniref:Uncharacterized protein n=1 Tax=Pectobacterium versatile TaxID=2488639 RepID=A0A855MFV8_9GAMM|nr:hypothetical protein F131LOC_02751 [Pectobacterium versatile]
MPANQKHEMESHCDKKRNEVLFIAITLRGFFYQEKRQSGMGRTLWHPMAPAE